jgi:hypothetical protein
MNTLKILNIISNGLRGREIAQRKSPSSQYECQPEIGTTCEHQISSYLPQAHNSELVYNILAGSVYPYKSKFG